MATRSITGAPPEPDLDPERFEELDIVALREPVRLDGPERLPEGAQGTIVGVWGGGQAFEVEFTEPVPALLTLRLSQVRRAPAT